VFELPVIPMFDVELGCVIFVVTELEEPEILTVDEIPDPLIVCIKLFKLPTIVSVIVADEQLVVLSPQVSCVVFVSPVIDDVYVLLDPLIANVLSLLSPT
jgi:hypothetical protein